MKQPSGVSDVSFGVHVAVRICSEKPQGLTVTARKQPQKTKQKWEANVFYV